MQPYQKATEAVRRQAEEPTNILKTAVSIGGSLAGGGAIASRVLPLLSKYIPGEMMRKGLSKIDPKIGGFVEGALNNGYSLDDVRSYMEGKFSESEPKMQESKPIDPLQSFETTYPDIASALARTMQNGQSPDAAAAILKNSSSFAKDIKKLEKETGKNFIDYVLELFGNRGQQQQPQQQMQQQPEMQQQIQPQGQLGGGVDAQLMAALDKILKM